MDHNYELNEVLNDPAALGIYLGPDPPQLFIELQELVPRKTADLLFDESIFATPYVAHFKVLWLEIARWVKFEEDYNKIEQRFNEPHVSPMRYTMVGEFREQIKNLIIKSSDAVTLGNALTDVAKYAFENSLVTTPEQYNVLRAILLAERWHPDVKGHISDAAEFNQYWENMKPTQMTEHRNGDTISSHAMVSTLNNHHDGHQPYHRYNQTLTARMPVGSEACSVICGKIEFLTVPVMILLRLENTIKQSCISELDLPVRFIFLYLGPTSADLNYKELARIFAIMMTSQTFRLGVYNARTSRDVSMACEAFLHDSLMMPFSEHYTVDTLAGMVRHINVYKREMLNERDPERLIKSVLSSRKPSQIEMTAMNYCHNNVSSHSLSKIDELLTKTTPTPTNVEKVGFHAKIDLPCRDKPNMRKRFLNDFCPPFIDLYRGFRPWLKRLPSDYTDAFAKDNVGTVLGSVLFMYFVNLSPSITFAALLNTQVDPSYTIAMSLLSIGTYLILFSIFAGQPLAIIGTSAPAFIMETTIVSVARALDVEIGQIRFWTSIYAVLFGIVCIAFNLSVMANHIRQSVEEVYNSFIGFFFLLKALFTMFLLIPSSPVNDTPEEMLNYYKKLATAGITLFLAFVMLQFSLTLAKLKQGKFFRRIIRKLLGALNVPLGMILITCIERIFFQSYNLPKIDIPPSYKINTTGWFNVPNFDHVHNYDFVSASTIHGICLTIGLALSIVIFTEASLNGYVLVEIQFVYNKHITAMKNKAVKPNIFVIDLVLLQCVFPFISAFTGWPYVSGATVRTMSNLVALVKMEPSAPGMPHKIVGTVEQRVSGICVGLLVILSIFLGSILSYIPLAALYGMFLYMGVMGLRELQFVLRTGSLLKRRKHWEDWECLRGLPSRHILVFALIQGTVIGILIVFNVIADFSMANYVGVVFPVIILIYAIVREFALPKWQWLAVYLHQLDRKYKLNPSSMKSLGSASRNISAIQKESFISYHSTGNVTTNFIADPDSVDQESDSNDYIVSHDDGVIRQTWAT